MEITMEQYVTQMVEDGYMSENGEPLKCVHCDSKDMESKQYYENHYIVEIDITCKSCGKSAGNWSYGNWNLY